MEGPPEHAFPGRVRALYTSHSLPMNQHPKEDHASASLRNVAVVSIVAVLLMADVARLTIASAFVETRPKLASRLAPHSPDILAATAMAEVGEAAGVGGEPTEETLENLRLLLRTAPFQTEPLLVQAALAQRAGDYARAELLLKQARMRDPRSVAARYLLADVWARQGKTVESLREIAILGTFIPGATIQVVPALAEYARTPAAREELTAILDENPRLKGPLLNVLAADPDNAQLVLALAGDEFRPANRRNQQWQSRLISGFIGRGDYDQAHTLWRRFAGVGAGPAPFLFNGDFRRLAAPAPFNWSFTSSGAGLAEPENGRLRVLYFGRANAPLASQLLLLPPGTYRIESSISGNLVPGALAWTVRCPKERNQLLELRLGASTTPAATFTVPASGCPAQWLELRGFANETPQETDVRIGPMHLEKVRT